jgi:hypothetical protein
LKRLITLCLMSQFCMANGVIASPCVSDTFDRPLPGATDVVSFVTDVASVQFPAFWQQGNIGGFTYKIFANGEGVLRPTLAAQDWSIEMSCERLTQVCDFNPEGAPPDEAVRIAGVVGQCLIRADVVETDFMPPAVPEPMDDVSADIADLPDALPTPDIAPNSQCGLALVDEATDEAVMQRLLLMVGSDPGPVDGFLGPRTFAAMDDFVEDSGWNTSTTDVITLLDKLHCERVQ